MLLNQKHFNQSIDQITISKSVGMLSEPKSLCTAIDWLKRSGILLNQVFPCVLNDNYAHTDKENMYKNMYEYLFMTSQTCAFRMAMTRTDYYSYSYIYSIRSQSFN